MSSEMGLMKVLVVHMNYYVDLDIVTQHDTYSFQHTYPYRRSYP